jgi:adenylate cyclase
MTVKFKHKMVLTLKSIVEYVKEFLFPLSAILITLGLLYHHPRTLSPINRLTYDTLLPIRAPKYSSMVPVIIDIDQPTIERFGQHPLPRYIIADMVTRLNQADVVAIGINIDFSQPDLSSPERIRETLRLARNIRIGFTNLPGPLSDYDAYLARVTARAGNVVQSIYSSAVATGDAVQIPQNKTARYRVNFLGEPIDYRARIREIRSPLFPISSLANAASVGVADIRASRDGIVRHMPLLVKIDGEIYPSLALETFRIFLGIDEMILNVGRTGVESISMGDYLIPVGNSGRIRFPFPPHERSYDFLSAADILDGRIPAETLRGRIAFIGSSNIMQSDTVATPFEGHYPVLSLHAATIDAMISQSGIRVPQAMHWARPLGVILLILIFAFLQKKLPSAIYGIMTGGAFLGLILMSYLFMHGGLFVAPTYFLFAVTYMFLGHLVIISIQSRSERNLLYRTFSRYISPSIVKKLSRLPVDSLEGEEQEVSIMFSDIHRFSSISENMLPKDVVRMLNIYFAFMTKRIEKSSGVLDKFVGDGILSFWNAPIKLQGHQRIAVRTALEIQKEIGSLNKEIHSDFGINIKVGLSIHCSAVFIGNVGSTEKMDYTIIGDGVNMASRLESLCKEYGVGIIVSEYIRSAASGKEFVFRYLDNVRVRGRNASMKIYEPMYLGDAEEMSVELKKWGRFIDLYNSKDFEKAIRLINELLYMKPDSVLYKLYKKRVKRLIENPPKTWSGVWYFDDK